MSTEFTHFEKIDMHSHIGAVGEPFNINPVSYTHLRAHET